MRNITVSVDEETYRLARIKAAERDTSVSALVRRYLETLAAGGDAFDRLAANEETIRARVKAFDASVRLDREAAHRRGK
jgi:predicted CopG family antitoxin